MEKKFEQAIGQEVPKCDVCPACKEVIDPICGECKECPVCDIDSEASDVQTV